MGLISYGVNTYYAYKILRRLSQRWEDTPAFKAGIIDKTGKKIVDTMTPDQSRQYNALDRIIYNIKRVISKVPGSQNPFIRYGTALALLREDELTEEQLDALLEGIELDLDPRDDMDEDTPIVTVGSGNIALTPTLPKNRKMATRKKLSEALTQKRVSKLSEIV